MTRLLVLSPLLLVPAACSSAPTPAELTLTARVETMEPGIRPIASSCDLAGGRSSGARSGASLAETTGDVAHGRETYRVVVRGFGQDSSCPAWSPRPPYDGTTDGP